MTDVAYAVSTPVFEGPFDLLLHLISQQQVDIHEVSLSTIVDAFCTELEHLDHVDLESASEFLLIASILVELKVRRLLPGPRGVDLDDELSLWEERDLLLARLLECKTFKDAAALLGGLALAASRSFPRRLGPDERFAGLVPGPAGRDHRRPAEGRLRPGHHPQAGADGRPRPRHPHPGSGGRRRGRAGPRAAPGRPDHRSAA